MHRHSDLEPNNGEDGSSLTCKRCGSSLKDAKLVGLSIVCRNCRCPQ